MLLRRLTSALFAGALLFGLATAPAARAEDPADRGATILRVTRPDHVRLDNGLEVVLAPDTTSSLVAVLVAYGVGSGDDPPGYQGLAHLVEHMTFRGSRHLRAQGIFEQLESVGAVSWNGVTSKDMTLYYAVVPARHFALPLWFESERMAFTLERFDQASFDIERSRVQKEVLQRGLARAGFDFHVNQSMFPEGHPYRRTSRVLEDLAAIELSDARWFFQRHYRPDNARLLLVGNFDRHKALSAIRRYFAPVGNPPGSRARRAMKIRPLARRQRLTFEDGSFIGNRLKMIFPATAGASAEAATTDAIVHLLEQGPNSLWNLLGEQLGVAESVDVDLDRTQLANHLVIEVRVREGVESSRVEAAVQEHLLAFQRFDDVAALRAATRDLEFDVVRSLEGVLQRALHHLDSLQTFGRPFDPGARIAALRQVTPADVRRVAVRGFAGGRLVARHLRSRGIACLAAKGCLTHEVERAP